MQVMNVFIEIQKLLYDQKLLQFDDIDGKVGPKTRQAIDKYLKQIGINTDKWSASRKLTAIEQVVLKDQKLYFGDIDGLVGQQTQHAREAHQANLVLTWRDRYEKIFGKKPEEPSQGRAIDRSQFFDELKDMNTIRAFAGRMASEVGSQGKDAQVAWAETTYNRAAARKKTLLQTVTGSYFPTNDPGSSDNKVFHQIIREVAEKGTNTTNGATGNASGMVGFGQGKTVKKDDGSVWAPGQTAQFGGERFGIEGPDKNWTPKYLDEKIASSSTSNTKTPVKIVWPLQRDCMSFFGDVGTKQVSCQVPFPLVLPWDKKTKLTRYQCHTLVKEPMERIWQRTLDFYGIQKIQELGINLFAGCLNVRPIRGGSTWSMHSWGIAVDIDPDRNALHTTWKDSQMSKPEYKKFVEFWYDEGFINLGKEANFDSMHFQAARLR